VDLRNLAPRCPRQTVEDGRFCIGPAALPEGELGEVTVVEAVHAVLAKRCARGL
jgi:hypothetical protein